MRRWRARRDGESEDFPGFSDVHPIGEGGFSTVFRARELAANRLVALKLLRVDPAVSRHAVECFQRETLALGALSAHPNILTLYRSFTTSDGRPVLVLELCRSSAGRRLREHGTLALPEALSLGIKVAGALETAHRAGMLHRDVKPQNVLLTEYGEPALADFGVAHLQDRGPASGGVVAFTTLHAAPELLEGNTPTPATDVYGLASSLYELISGQPAFRAFDGESPASVALRVLRDPVSPLLAVPLALSDLLLAAMAKAPGARPPSALAFAEALGAIERAAGWGTTRCVIGPDPASEASPAVQAAVARPPGAPPPAPTPAAPEPALAVTSERGRIELPEPLGRVAAAVVPPVVSKRRVLVPVPRHQSGDAPHAMTPPLPGDPALAGGDAALWDGRPAPAFATWLETHGSAPTIDALEDTVLRRTDTERAPVVDSAPDRRRRSWRRRRSDTPTG